MNHGYRLQMRWQERYSCADCHDARTGEKEKHEEEKSLMYYIQPDN